MARESLVPAAAARRIALVTFVGGVGGGLVFPILPALGLQLGIAGAMIGLILSANRITRLAFDTLAGRLVDRFGGKRPLTLGLLLECVSILGYSAGLHFAHPAWWFLGGRALFGVGSALLFVGAQATVLGLSGDADRGRRLASVRVAMGMGLPGGLVLGGLIADRVSDDAAFLTGAGLTFVGALTAWGLVPAARAGARASRRHDNICSRIGRMARKPEFPFMATAWGFNLLVFLSVQGVLLATLVVLVQQRGLHLMALGGEGTAGMVMAAMMGAASVMAVSVGRRVDRLALRSSLLVPALAGLVGGFMLLGIAHSLTLTFTGALLVGASVNGITLPMLALLGDITPKDQYGRAVGVYQFFGDVGGSLGPVVGLEAVLHMGLTASYVGMGVLLTASVPAAVWARRRERAWRCHKRAEAGARID